MLGVHKTDHARKARVMRAVVPQPAGGAVRTGEPMLPGNECSVPELSGIEILDPTERDRYACTRRK
jgi:hypothetical protein